MNTPYLCPTCDGEGGSYDRPPVGAPTITPCALCGSTGDLLLGQLERQTAQLARIARALEVIARDITARRQREQDSLVNRARHLRRVARRASDRFGSADNAAARRSPHETTVHDRDYLRRMEAAAEHAWSAYEAFAAEHPDIVAQIEAEQEASVDESWPEDA